MKKVFLLFLILAIPSISCGGLLSGLIKNDISAVKSEIEKVDNKLDAKINTNVSAISKINADLKANASVMAGFNNKLNQVNTSAGRDITQDSGNVNDTGLMKVIFKYWYGIFVLIIGFMKWNELKIIGIMKSEIKRLKVEKQDYKDQFIARCIKDENELAEWRKHHEAVKMNAE